MEKIVATLDPAIDRTVGKEFRRALDQLKAGDKGGAAATALSGWSQMPAPVFGWDKMKIQLANHLRKVDSPDVAGFCQGRLRPSAAISLRPIMEQAAGRP